MGYISPFHLTSALNLAIVVRGYQKWIVEAVEAESIEWRSWDNVRHGGLMHLAFTVPKPFIVSN